MRHVLCGRSGTLSWAPDRDSSAGRGRVIATMRHIEEFSAGRCAGPLAADFAGALPRSQSRASSST
jgi:hypothetical protein